ncbi:MAG: hypothetical protein Q8P60_16775 [Pseudorhodobacter sp.]|nr:hypothetical protein [Pseudorhodobacter sp.]
MNRKTQMQRLGQLSGLILDIRLSQLHAAARARVESQARLAGLDAPQASDLPPIAAAQAGLLYERWAEVRRAEINLLLSRQTAVWLEAQTSARQAFGRSEAVQSVQKKLCP